MIPARVRSDMKERKLAEKARGFAEEDDEPTSVDMRRRRTRVRSRDVSRSRSRSRMMRSVSILAIAPVYQNFYGSLRASHAR